MKKQIVIFIISLIYTDVQAQLLSDSNINIQDQPSIIILNDTITAPLKPNTPVSPLISPENETYIEQFEEQTYKPAPIPIVENPLVENDQPWFDSAFWDTSKVAKSNIELNKNNKRVYIDAALIKERKKTKNILFLLMVFILSILLIIVIQIFPSKHRLHKLAYLSRIRFKDILEAGIGYSIGMLVQMAVSILAFSMYFSSISAYIPHNTLPYSLTEIIGYTILFFSLVLFSDLLFIVIYFYAYDKNKIIKPLILLQVAVDYTFSLILFPLSLILYYNFTTFSLDNIWILLLSPLVLWWLVKLFKSIYIIKSETNSVDFYDMLYFCTFKILPLLLFIKWLWF